MANGDRPSITPVSKIIGENGSRIDRVGTVAVLGFMLYWFMGEAHDQNIALQNSIEQLRMSVLVMRDALRALAGR